MVLGHLLSSQTLFPNIMQSINEGLILAVLMNTNIIKVFHLYLDYQSYHPQARIFPSKKTQGHLSGSVT